MEDARTEQALHSYEQTVLDALEEVETAMSDYQQEQLRTAALERSVAGLSAPATPSLEELFLDLVGGERAEATSERRSA